jgi:hypothetical protein
LPKTHRPRGLPSPVKPIASASALLQRESDAPLSWMTFVSNFSAEISDEIMTGDVSNATGATFLVSKATACVFSCQASCKATLCLALHPLILHLIGD